MIIASPTPQSPSITRPHLDEPGPKNQSGGACIPNALRIWLIGPNSGLNTRTNASAAAAGGAIVGRKYTGRYTLDPDLGSVRSQAVKIANATRKGTPTRMIQMVLRSASQKNGSFENMKTKFWNPTHRGVPISEYLV